MAVFILHLFHFFLSCWTQIWWGRTHPLIVVYYVVNAVAQCSNVVTFIVKRLDTISHSQKCPFIRVLNKFEMLLFNVQRQKFKSFRSDKQFQIQHWLFLAHPNPSTIDNDNKCVLCDFNFNIMLMYLQTMCGRQWASFKGPSTSAIRFGKWCDWLLSLCVLNSGLLFKATAIAVIEN